MSRTYHLHFQRNGWEWFYPHISISLLSWVFKLLWITQPDMLLIFKYSHIYFAAKKKSLNTFIFFKKEFLLILLDFWQNSEQFFQNQHLSFQIRHLFYKSWCNDSYRHREIHKKLQWDLKSVIDHSSLLWNIHETKQKRFIPYVKSCRAIKEQLSQYNCPCMTPCVDKFFCHMLSASTENVRKNHAPFTLQIQKKPTTLYRRHY